MEVKKRVGYLAEHNPLYSDMYVREFLFFIAGVYGIKDKKAKVDEMIELTGLTKEQNKYIGQLSKGYKQRVGLAQVLLNDPEVLILDEPTTGLDPNQLKEIRSLIKETGKDKTVIFSTHIMQEVQALCDRVIILNDGKIVADDTIDRLDEYLVKDIKSILIQFDERVNLNKIKSLNSISSVDVLKDNYLKIEGEDDYLMRKDIFKFAVENDYTLLAMHKENIDVESIFSKLTN
jgi:ABC-2 type transport system ATP-binding protein